MQRRRFVEYLALAGGAGAVAIDQSLLADDVVPGTLDTRKKAVRFAHLTDIHINANRSAPIGLATALKHVRSLQDPPEFIVNGGDAVYDALAVDRSVLQQQWELWHRIWNAENSLPVKHCLGNHDVWGWDEKSATDSGDLGWGKAFSLDQLKLDSSYYTFEHAGWKFVVLDSITKDKQTVYRAELDEAQFKWLKRVLGETATSTPIVIISHIPILTVGDVGWSRQLAEQPIGHQMLVHQDRGELLKLFGEYSNVKLCLSGHTHLTERIDIAGISFVNSGAVCGQWWKGNNAHTDEGYSVIDLYDDGSFQTDYVSYGWDAK